jgi:hypothetical protein
MPHQAEPGHINARFEAIVGRQRSDKMTDVVGAIAIAIVVPDLGIDEWNPGFFKPARLASVAGRVAMVFGAKTMYPDAASASVRKRDCVAQP